MPWPWRPARRRPGGAVAASGHRRRGLSSPLSPRVVWLGLGGDVVPLTRLFYGLEKAFTTLGYLPEGRAFNPHLTLGRVKSPANRDRLAKMLAKCRPWTGRPLRSRS